MRELTAERQAKLQALLVKLEIPQERLDLLDTALTHSSYRLEVPGAVDYERLEFFGDAVLKFVTSEYLFRRFPDYAEGKLTEIRAVLVSAKTLAWMAEAVGLGEYILYSRRFPMTPAIMSRSMEAILGAIYMDSGFEHVGPMIIRFLKDKTEEIHENANKENYKAQLQEYSQARSQGCPQYKVIDKSGPAHDTVFEVNVVVSGIDLGKGSGKSKKEAEQEAARMALETLAVKKYF